MKKSFFVLLVMLTTICANAQGIDSLQQKEFYNEYIRNYRLQLEKEQTPRERLINTAVATFSPDKAMAIAPDLYMSSNDQSMTDLMQNIVNEFLDKDFLQISCHHYEREMEPILAVYSTDICSYVTNKLSVLGNGAAHLSNKQLEEILTEGALAQAKSEAFKSQAAQMRTEYGQDMILHSLGCSPQYIYAGCKAMRRLVTQASNEKILSERAAYIYLQERRFLNAIDTAVINNNYSPFQQYYFNAAIPSKVRKALSRMHHQISKSLVSSQNISSTIISANGMNHIIYTSHGNDAQTFGGLQVQDSWVKGRKTIKTVKYISAKKVPASTK